MLKKFAVLFIPVLIMLSTATPTAVAQACTSEDDACFIDCVNRCVVLGGTYGACMVECEQATC